MKTIKNLTKSNQLLFDDIKLTFFTEHKSLVQQLRQIKEQFQNLQVKFDKELQLKDNII